VDRNRTDTREGRYANHLEVGRNEEELVMDFGQVFEGEPPLIHTRIITHPSFAREIVELLHDSVEAGQAVGPERKKPRHPAGSKE
jgi:hypothetical protein